MKITKQLIMIASSLLISLSAAALPARSGNEGAHGGDGLWLNGKLYVLDLVEAGIQREPYFNRNVTVDPLIAARLNAKFDPQKFPVAFLAKKLSEVYAVDKVFALSILRGMELYSWRFVDSSLVDIHDEESSLKYSPKDLEQLASRVSATIRIDNTLWAKLDAWNKAALVFHETLYAMVTPYAVTDPATGDFVRNPATGRQTGEQAQSSQRARDMVGYLLSTDLDRGGLEGLIRMADLPGGKFMIGGATNKLVKWDSVWSAIRGTPELYIHHASDVWNSDYLGIKLDWGMTEIRTLVSRLCPLVVKTGVRDVLGGFGLEVEVKLGTYRAKDGDRVRIEVIHSPFKQRYIEQPKPFTDEASCVDRYSEAIAAELTTIQSEYR